MTKRAVIVAVLSALMLLAPAWAQQLAIQPGNGKQVVLARSDIEALPRVKVSTILSGTSSTFEGASLKSVLERGGVGFSDLKGKGLASCLFVQAADGYQVVIALPELDPAFGDKQFILAFLKDGKPMDANEGPYRIVIPDEKRPARWVRQVTALKIAEVQ